MVSKNTVLISLNRNTKESLDKMKLHPSLSYNDVIVQLLAIRDNVVKEEIKRKEQEYALNQAKAEIDKLVQAREFTEDREIPSLQQEPEYPGEVDDTL